MLLSGPKRFGELHKAIQGIALKVLSRHLKELEADGIINRKVYAEVPPKVEYTLTEKGMSLNDVMQLLAEWGKKTLGSQVRDFGICYEYSSLSGIGISISPYP